MQIPPHIRGLIFDCDGTIADTMPAHYAAWVAALSEQGVEFSEAMFYEMAGMPTRAIIEWFKSHRDAGLDVERVFHRREAVYESMLDKARPIEPVVAIVRKYKGVLPMAVASGGTRPIVQRTLQVIQLDQEFDALVTADDVKHGKPAPDIFLESARWMNLNPEYCFVFEDADLGLRAAQSAGMMAFDVRPWLNQMNQSAR